MPFLARKFMRLAPETVGWGLVAVLSAWLLASYWLVPDWWKHREARHSALTNGPRITMTSIGIPGDPVNLSIVGSEQELRAAFQKAGWYSADPITFKTSIRIAESTLLHRPYEDAPVSNLFLFSRMEDLAFEKPVGRDASQRHHVRFWRAQANDESGRTGWLGAVTFDRSVGFSHTTGQITHHIAPDIDIERDGIIADLQRVGQVDQIEWQDDFQNPREGRNGGGDPWRTDGRLPVIVLKAAGN
jgi:hypothetical protein